MKCTCGWFRKISLLSKTLCIVMTAVQQLSEHQRNKVKAPNSSEYHLYLHNPRRISVIVHLASRSLVSELWCRKWEISRNRGRWALSCESAAIIQIWLPSSAPFLRISYIAESKFEDGFCWSTVSYSSGSYSPTAGCIRNSRS